MIKITWTEDKEVRSATVASIKEADSFTAALESRGVTRYKIVVKTGPAVK